MEKCQYNKLTRITAGLLATFLASPLIAEQVTLNSTTDGVSISGDLISFDGSVYTIDTVLGALNVKALSVTCDGPGCPQVSEDVEVVKIGSDFAYSRELSAILAASLASNIDGEVQTDETTNLDVVLNPLGQAVANFDAIDGIEVGFDELIRGDIDVLFSLQQVADSTLANIGLESRIVGLDGAVVVVGTGSSVRALSEDSLAKIFAGQITNWNELGYPAAPINVYRTENQSAAFDLFLQRVLESRGLSLRSNVRTVATEADLDVAVANDPAGLSVLSYSSINNARVTVVRGQCGLQIAPTAFTIKTEEYPFTQRVVAYYRAANSKGVLRSTIDLLSDDGTQKLIEASDLVSLDLAAQSVDQQGLRFQSSLLSDDTEISLNDLQGLFGSLLNADRLSITFRFETSSARLDQRSLQDIDRLNDLASRGLLDNKTILLMGFTDSVGSAAQNRVLAEQRAAAVQASLNDVSLEGSLEFVTMSPIGIGEISPVSCNDSDFGRDNNRRVEVWIRDTVQQAE